jgi:hypothetical protein
MDYLINHDGSIDKNPSTIDYKLAQHFYNWHKKQDQSCNPMSDPNTDMHHLLSTFEQFTSAHRHMNIPDDVLRDIYDAILYPTCHDANGQACDYEQSTHCSAHL